MLMYLFDSPHCELDIFSLIIQENKCVSIVNVFFLTKIY
jgi:hypothetical protein